MNLDNNLAVRYLNMKAKSTHLIVVLLVLTSVFYLTLVTLPVNVKAATHYVGGTGPGNYSKIQLAIDASSPGDTVFVYSGTYDEDVGVYKSLDLIGENKYTTKIRGSGASDAVVVTEDWVNVTGFTVENSGTMLGESGMRLFFVQNCYVANIIASNNERGISVWESQNNIIHNNTVTSNRIGIYVQNSPNIRITHNAASDNGVGIYLERAYDTTITNNTLSGNGDGIVHFNSSYTVMANNVMTGVGVFIDGTSLEDWNTHFIDTSNTIEGRPVRYWKNMTGGTVPLSNGQVILANCNNVVVEDQNVNNGTLGIEVGFSSYVTIADNIASYNYRDGIYISESDNITVTGNNASNNGDGGISIARSISNVLTDNTVSSNLKNGIFCYDCDINTITRNSIFLNGPPPPIPLKYSAVYLTYSDYSMITENSVFSNLNAAFALHNSDNNSISSNIFSNNGNGVFLREAYNNSLVNNRILGNDVVGISLDASSHNLLSANNVTRHLGGIVVQDESHDNTLLGNYVSSYDTSAGRSGIIISESSSHVLANNVMIGDGLVIDGETLEHWNTHIIDTSNSVNGRPVYYWKNGTGGMIPSDASEVILANWTGATVENLILRNGTAGIELGFSSNNTVTNNAVSDSKRGIHLVGSDGNDISGNTVSSPNLNGIDLLASNGNTLSDNTIWGGIQGIILFGSDDNDITGNSVWDNTDTNIFLYRYLPGIGSRNNNITYNSFFNSRYGVQIHSDSDNNIVALNSIVDNMNGVYIGGSSSNRIHHNNIIDNALQGYDDRDDNQWDDGYPSGGNYWSDYSGVDAFNGPNQDIPGSDFIGDTPYVIDFNSEDRYPLMNPFLTASLVPSAPKNLKAVPGDRLVTLTWAIPSFEGSLPIINYRIYRGIAPGEEIFYAQIGNVLTYLDSGLTNGQIYCYRVSAVNGVGEGPLSNEACATPTAPPGAPVILQADLSGDTLENVTVKWNLSLDDGTGQDSVVGYSIYRGTTYDVNAVGYLLIVTVPEGTILYVDNFTGEGDPNNYFYRICAVDLNNLTNCSVNQAGKFTRSLTSGPNLVSIPLIQSDENIETVLQTLKWDKAWTYDSSAQKWKSHILFKPYKGELEELNVSMGIWINVMQPSNLTVSGIVPTNTSIYLQAGWNLVGFPSFNGTYTVSDLKASVGVERIEAFEASTQPYFLQVLMDGDALQAGYGYWIEAKSNTTWVVVGS